MDAEQEYYISLIERLRNLPEETEWLEFKVNNDAPDMIGEYISALSNSAAICERETAYLLWGINDKTHEIEETNFLRIVRICEERGSGFDRMEEGMRDLTIPAPKVETGDVFSRTKLYWYASLTN